MQTCNSTYQSNIQFSNQSSQRKQVKFARDNFGDRNRLSFKLDRPTRTSYSNTVIELQAQLRSL